MAATADPHATRAAVEILQRGGNAVDAAIAAQWVLNVVEPQSSGIGGGAFFLYYDALTKHVHAFDGREAAPAEAFPEMFWDPKTQEPYPFYPDRITGGLSVGVPGTLKLLEEVHKRFGSRNFKFGDLFLPAIHLAKRGFPVSERLARYIDQEKERLRMFPESSRIFLDAKSEPLKAGTILFQPDLAKTFQLIRRKGTDVFYRGGIARDIVHTVRNAPYHPGTMALTDLAHYRVYEREPVRGSYRGFDLFSMGPPSSGGPAMIEALNILENYPLGSYGRLTEGIHLFSEAQSLAFEDRNQYLGDPGYSRIPLDQILSKQHAQYRAQEIRMDLSRASLYAQNRLVPEGMHTSHMSLADEQGNVVAFTTTIESLFGSGMVVKGRGFVLNNELTDFDADQPYLKSEAQDKKLHPNAPEGDKRPRSSMTPTLIFKAGKPFTSLGSPGGSTIIGTVLNLITNVIDFEMTLKEAIETPRVINRENKTEMETPLMAMAPLIQGLEKKQHSIEERPVIGNAQVILWDDARGVWIGESDPRGEGEAAGY